MRYRGVSRGVALAIGVITAMSASFPALAAENGAIAFVSNRDGGDPEIYVMEPDGSGQRRLTHNIGPDQEPEWAPDGSKIAYATDQDFLSGFFVSIAMTWYFGALWSVRK